MVYKFIIVDLLRPEKKVLVVCLAGCAVMSVFGSSNYNRKKRYSRLSGGLCCCVSFWFWRLQPEKEVTVFCLDGCAVVSVFGSGDYDRKKKVLVVCLAGARSLLRPKKKEDTFVCLVGARSLLQPEKKDTVICLAGARLLLLPEKKVPVVCLVGARSLLRPEKKIQLSVWRVRNHYYDRKKDTVVCLAGA